MTELSVEPSCHISHITSTPAGKWGTPSDTTMHPSFPIPQAIGSSHQGGTKGINQRIGSLKTQLPDQLLMEQILLPHKLRTVLGIHQYKVVIIDKAQISDSRGIPLQLLAQRVRTIGQCLKILARVSSQIAIALHFHFRNGSSQSYKFQRLLFAQYTLGESFGFELPQGIVALVLCNGLNKKFATKPRFITYHILPLATFIISMTIGSRVERIKAIAHLNVELDIPGFPLVIGRKQGTVAGFESPIGMRTIESTRIAVPSVLANKTTTFGKILQIALTCCNSRNRQHQR